LKRSYKGYKVETVVRVESGLWKAWATITPPLREVSDLSKGGYGTRAEAESAVWEVAKGKIDQATCRARDAT
jgi:hypothetical protein